MPAMRILDHLTRHWKKVAQPRSPGVWIDLFGKQACAPHELPATLRRIDAFAEQENCKVTLVLVRNNSDRNENRFHPRHVTLVSVESSKKRAEILLHNCRKIAREGGVIITGDADLEKELGPTGVPLMRFSTFEKALSLASQSNPSAPASTSSDRRPPENRAPRAAHPHHSSRTSPPPLAQKNNSQTRQHAILDLIDPL